MKNWFFRLKTAINKLMKTAPQQAKPDSLQAIEPAEPTKPKTCFEKPTWALDKVEAELAANPVLTQTDIKAA
mgnify:CR=1 FL=1